MHNIYGSLCIFADMPCKDFPQFTRKETSPQTPHKYRGLLQIDDSDSKTLTFSVPQRSKNYLLYSYGDSSFSSVINSSLQEKLPLMENEYEDARQLYKFYRVQKDLASMNQARAFVTCIVNAGEHSHIALLCQWKDLSVHGVYDTVNKSVRLVWTDDEWFIKDLRSLESNRYVFYRFPIVQDRPLFMYTQALCSKWYKWQKQFNEADGILKSFNALERYLYKEPEIPNLNINNGHS